MDKKKLVETYVRAYNSFDVERMLETLHDEVIFRNISNDEVTLELKGREAFREQAELAAGFFSEREQKITNFSSSGDHCEIEIDYRAVAAADLPNGLKAGELIELQGKSLFHFKDGKISLVEDIS